MHTVSTQDTLECGPVHLMVANRAIQPIANSSSIQLQPKIGNSIYYLSNSLQKNTD
jgi:hypothetical protein